MHIPPCPLTHLTPFNIVESTTHLPIHIHNTHRMGMKGHPQSNCGGGGTGSGGGGGWMMNKKIAVVAVMVILVGVMGVMVVQKVKDRRLFSLVIKDKDRQILALNLILQKERQYVKENKRKNQDLNAKLYSLRTQKTELTNKIMEMRSAIGSMREDQRALELAIDEKQNEIKRKEFEIRDLKSSLQSQPNIWSGNSIDPSNHEANLTNEVTTTKVKEIINSNVKVQNPKDEDSEELSSLKSHNDEAKIEMLNTTKGELATKETSNSEENEVGLVIKGRRFFIGATESQRDKSNGQNEETQSKANPEEDRTGLARFKSNRSKGEADRKNEAGVDMNTSRNGSEEDKDYKEETED